MTGDSEGRSFPVVLKDIAACASGVSGQNISLPAPFEIILVRNATSAKSLMSKLREGEPGDNNHHGYDGDAHGDIVSCLAQYSLLALVNGFDVMGISESWRNFMDYSFPKRLGSYYHHGNMSCSHVKTLIEHILAFFHTIDNNSSKSPTNFECFSFWLHNVNKSSPVPASENAVPPLVTFAVEFCTALSTCESSQTLSMSNRMYLRELQRRLHTHFLSHYFVPLSVLPPLADFDSQEQLVTVDKIAKGIYLLKQLDFLRFFSDDVFKSEVFLEDNVATLALLHSEQLSIDVFQEKLDSSEYDRYEDFEQDVEWMCQRVRQVFGMQSMVSFYVSWIQLHFPFEIKMEAHTLFSSYETIDQYCLELFTSETSRNNDYFKSAPIRNEIFVFDVLRVLPTLLHVIQTPTKTWQSQLLFDWPITVETTAITGLESGRTPEMMLQNIVYDLGTCDMNAFRHDCTSLMVYVSAYFGPYAPITLYLLQVLRNLLRSISKDTGDTVDDICTIVSNHTQISDPHRSSRRSYRQLATALREQDAFLLKDAWFVVSVASQRMNLPLVIKNALSDVLKTIQSSRIANISSVIDQVSLIASSIQQFREEELYILLATYRTLDRLPMEEDILLWIRYRLDVWSDHWQQYHQYFQDITSRKLVTSFDSIDENSGTIKKEESVVEVSVVSDNSMDEDYFTERKRGVVVDHSSASNSNKSSPVKRGGKTNKANIKRKAVVNKTLETQNDKHKSGSHKRQRLASIENNAEVAVEVAVDPTPIDHLLANVAETNHSFDQHNDSWHQRTGSMEEDDNTEDSTVLMSALSETILASAEEATIERNENETDPVDVDVSNEDISTAEQSLALSFSAPASPFISADHDAVHDGTAAVFTTTTAVMVGCSASTVQLGDSSETYPYTTIEAADSTENSGKVYLLTVQLSTERQEIAAISAVDVLQSAVESNFVNIHASQPCTEQAMDDEVIRLTGNTFNQSTYPVPSAPDASSSPSSSNSTYTFHAEDFLPEKNDEVVPMIQRSGSSRCSNRQSPYAATASWPHSPITSFLLAQSYDDEMDEAYHDSVVYEYPSQPFFTPSFHQHSPPEHCCPSHIHNPHDQQPPSYLHDLGQYQIYHTCSQPLPLPPASAVKEVLPVSSSDSSLSSSSMSTTMPPFYPKNVNIAHHHGPVVETVSQQASFPVIVSNPSSIHSHLSSDHTVMFASISSCPPHPDYSTNASFGQSQCHETAGNASTSVIAENNVFETVHTTPANTTAANHMKTPLIMQK